MLDISDVGLRILLVDNKESQEELYFGEEYLAAVWGTLKEGRDEKKEDIQTRTAVRNYRSPEPEECQRK